MENHTKRIRKARRQGLAKKKDGAPSRPNREAAQRRGPRAQTPAAPAPNARRRGTLTQRKTERMARGAMRRVQRRTTPR